MFIALAPWPAPPSECATGSVDAATLVAELVKGKLADVAYQG